MTATEIDKLTKKAKRNFYMKMYMRQYRADKKNRTVPIVLKVKDIVFPPQQVEA